MKSKAVARSYDDNTTNLSELCYFFTHLQVQVLSVLHAQSRIVQQIAGCRRWTGPWSRGSGSIDAWSCAVRLLPSRSRRHLHVPSRNKDPRVCFKDDAATPHRSSVWIHPDRACYSSPACHSLHLRAQTKGLYVQHSKRFQYSERLALDAWRACEGMLFGSLRMHDNGMDARASSHAGVCGLGAGVREMLRVRREVREKQRVSERVVNDDVRAVRSVTRERIGYLIPLSRF